MDIEKIEGMTSEYRFKCYKTVKDRHGNDVEVLGSEETTTLKNLQTERQVYVDTINVIDSKIEAINNLK